MENQNRKKVLKITGFVILFLALFIGALFLGEYLLSSNSENSTQKKEQVEAPSSREKAVNKRLDNHEKRIVKLEKHAKITDKRLDLHADAIGDLQEQINKLKDKPEKKMEADADTQPQKENKYKKGWDYQDFPENW